MDVNQIIGRDGTLFRDAVATHEKEIAETIGNSRVLIYGGAGSIGREVVRQIFMRRPKALCVVDISENGLVELVRDLRSSLGYIEGDTQFLPLDMGSVEAAAFLQSQPDFDIVVNLAAMKHVRSEKDEFSLMRMIRTNVLDTLTSLEGAIEGGAKKYFAVSTDKAKNPASLMGATKRIMESALFSVGGDTTISTARFANVAFSDGSLLHGFRQRLVQQQPLSAPRDVRRYFVTGEESGLLCLSSIVLGKAREIFFPHLDAEADLLTFSEIARRFLTMNGYEPYETESEDEARDRCAELIAAGKWPCYFFDSDTAGEKPFEEFYSEDDKVDWSRFEDIGVIEVPPLDDAERDRTGMFLDIVRERRRSGEWSMRQLTEAIEEACPDLDHVVSQKSLDQKM